jgi:uncharacterized membrane protein YphA (DoxX/SURF4 family)
MRTALREIHHALAVHPAASPAWLLLRVYLGSIWLRFGMAKIQGGWLAGDQLEGLLRAVADGATPVWVPAVRTVAGALLGLGLDRPLCVAIPLLELAVALALFAGVALVPATLGASLFNLNLILMGLAGWRFDGRMIVLQLLLLAGWRSASYLGIGTLARTVRRGRLRTLPVPHPSR